MDIIKNRINILKGRIHNRNRSIHLILLPPFFASVFITALILFFYIPEKRISYYAISKEIQYINLELAFNSDCSYDETCVDKRILEQKKVNLLSKELNAVNSIKFATSVKSIFALTALILGFTSLFFYLKYGRDQALDPKTTNNEP